MNSTKFICKYNCYTIEGDSFPWLTFEESESMKDNYLFDKTKKQIHFYLLLVLFSIFRYVRNEFERDYKPTIGVEYELKKYSILKTVFSLQM